MSASTEAAGAPRAGESSAPGAPESTPPPGASATPAPPATPATPGLRSPAEPPSPAELDLEPRTLGRIAWATTSAAFLVAVVILLARGDIGYAAVTFAVALAAAINLL